MKRILLVVVGVVIGALATGAVLIARAGNGGNPGVVGAGFDTATNNVSACSAIGGGGGQCKVTMTGDYFSNGLLGNGKYSGKLVIDWSTYAVNPNDNNEMCASASGTITYTSGSSVLKARVVGASDFSQSYVCEQPDSFPPYAWNRDYNLSGNGNPNVISGTGKFKNVIPSQSSVYLNGQMFANLNSAQTAPTGTYLDQPNIGPNLVVS